MSSGRVAQIGAPRDIYHKPENAFWANFIGSMNRLHARATDNRLELNGTSLAWKASRGVTSRC